MMNTTYFVRVDLKKLTVVTLVFLMVLTPIAPVFAQETTEVPVSSPSEQGSSEKVTPILSGQPAKSDSIVGAKEKQSDKATKQPIEKKNKDKDKPKDPENPIVDSPQALSARAAGASSSSNNKENASGKSNLPQPDSVSGALSYQYPIVVPPGRNGLQPDLNLSYNNQNGQNDSAFGYGWSISIPYIERLNKTGVNNLFTTNYYSSSLTGELIDLGSGSFGSKVDNGEFLTYSLASNIWTVKDKSGTVYKFGTSAAERQDKPTDFTKIYKWMLQEVRDANNNYIKYQYYKNAGQIYPSTIKYTGNGTTDGIFTVTFNREARPDAANAYNTAFAVTTNYRINQIQTAVSGTWVAKYDLAYTTGDNTVRSILQTITKSGRDESGTTTALPAMSFTNYTLPSYSLSSNGVTLPDSRPDFIDLADINGDSYTDVLVSYQLNGQPAVQKTYLNDAQGGWALSSAYAPPVLLGNNAFGPSVSAHHALTDVNGDGLVDFIGSEYAWGWYNWEFKVYLNTGTGWGSLSNTWAVPFQGNNGPTGATPDPYFMDVNGDGLVDLARVGSSNAVHLNTGSGWARSSIPWNFPVSLDEVPNVSKKFIDINGDSILDVLVSKRVDTYSGGGLHQVETKQAWIGNGINNFNLDSNYQPPIVFRIEHNNWPCGCIHDTGARIYDYNGDGLPDIVQAAQSLNIGAQDFNPPSQDIITVQRVYFNTGKGWTSPVTVNMGIYFSGGGSAPAGQYDFGDISANGITDILQYNGGTSAILRPSAGRNPADQVTRITYPEGGRTNVSYKPSTEYYYSLLNPNLPIVLSTVQTTETYDGIGVTATKNYTYEKGKYYFGSYTDRKFSGFGKVKATDSVGNKTITSLHGGTQSEASLGQYSDHISKAGKPYRIEMYDNSSNLYAKVINKWDRYDLGSGMSFVKLAQTVDSTYDGDSSHKDKAEVYTYSDTTGNQTQKVEYGEVTGSNDGTFSNSGTDGFTTDISYVSTTSPRLVGLPSQATVTDHTTAKVKESKYYYDAQSNGSAIKGNMTKQEDWKDGSTYVSVQKTYNSTYGTVASDIDQRGKITTYTNDSNNLYPAAVTNPLSQTNSYTYDYSSGQLKQKTDPNTRVYENIYDGLDRLIEVKQPDLASPGSLVTKTIIAYTDTPGSVGVLKSEYLDSSAVADFYAYFDGLGRKIQERKKTEGDYSVKDYLYNNRGLLHKESLPYSSSGSSKTAPGSTTSLYINYTYDPMMRVVAVVDNLGTTSNTYSDFKLTITDKNNKVKDLYKDVYGNLVRVDEHNNGNTYTTSYQYNYSGNLIKITDALGNIRNFTYDGLGRRLTAQDLHAPADITYGTWIYSYDDAGNLTEAIDPNGQTVDYTYDHINRALTEDYAGNAGIEIAYAYDSGTDGKGHLTSIATSTLSQTNTYNANGGLASEARVINSTTYTTSYNYDRQGNQTLITNPDLSLMKYIYNGAGLLNQVQRKELADAGYTDVVSNFDYSPTGQTATISYNNGATTTNTYDSTKLYRLTAKVTTIASSSHTQDLAYTYDAVGNITQIVDASNTDTSKTANYVYDDLYRLTQAAVTNVADGQSTYTENYTYDAIGNIISKTGAGDYTYAGNTGALYANPHAVTSTSTGAVDYTYDNNGNELTKGSSLTNIWDYNNRIIQTVAGGTTISYDYDASGQRIKYSNGTSTTYYPSKFYNTDGTTPKKHIFALGMEVGVVDGTGASAVVRYAHTDHLTGSGVVTNASNTADEVLDYYPFGGIRIDSGSYSDQRKFIGQEHDADTGLDYLNARYYDSNIGRFVSQDPEFWTLDLESLIDPQQLNSYSYARNNPLAYSDPDGRSFVSAVNFLDAHNPIYYFFAESTDKMINGAANNDWGAVGEGALEITKTTANIISTSIQIGMTAGTFYGIATGTAIIKVATTGNPKEINTLIKTLDKIKVGKSSAATVSKAESALSKAATHSLKKNHYPGLTKSEIESIAENTKRNASIKVNIRGSGAKQYYYDAKNNNLLINNPKQPTVFSPDRALDYLRTAVKNDLKNGGKIK